MAIATIPNKLILRKLTVFEEAAKIDFIEREARFESNVRDSAKTFAKDVEAMQQNIVNQVKRHKIISDKKINNLKKITVSDAKLKAHLLNAFGFTYFKGKKDARIEVEASLGHRVPIRGFTNFQDDITSLAPTEALEEFGRRQLVSKAEFTKMVARERARAFTVAGVVEKDMLNSTRQLVSKAIDQGWSVQDFQRGLKEANVKYTGTAYGTAAKAGEPIKPYHAETILRTNFTTIYNRGRMATMNDPDVVEFVPAYQYSAIMDSRTRETHAFMDGRVYLRDDPIWGEWLPSNGYNCRCMVIPVTSNIPFTVSLPTKVEPDTGFGGRELVVTPTATTPTGVTKNLSGRLTEQDMRTIQEASQKAANIKVNVADDIMKREEIRAKMIEDIGLPRKYATELDDLTSQGWVHSSESPDATRLRMLENTLRGRDPLAGLSKNQINAARGAEELRGVKILSATDEELRAAAAWREFNQETYRILHGDELVTYRGLHPSTYTSEIKKLARNGGTENAQIAIRPLQSESTRAAGAEKFSSDGGAVLHRKMKTSEIWDSHETSIMLDVRDFDIMEVISGTNNIETVVDVVIKSKGGF